MSLPKLLSILTEKSIFLARIALLHKDDPFEGSRTIKDLNYASRLLNDPLFRAQHILNYIGELPKEHHDVFLEYFSNHIGGKLKPLDDICFISCWHERPRESAALWKLYSDTQGGVAIRTTTAKLCQSVQSTDNLILGRIRYMDFEEEHMNYGNILSAAFCKRDSYSHECEVRLLQWLTDAPVDGLGRPLAEKPLRVDPASLIEEILVSPYADQWMVSTISNVVRGLGFNIPVQKSRLLEPPDSFVTPPP